jgi:hypothetical protein
MYMLFVSVLMHKNVSFHFKNVRLKNQGFYENHCQYLYWLRYMYVLPKSIIPLESQIIPVFMKKITIGHDSHSKSTKVTLVWERQACTHRGCNAPLFCLEILQIPRENKQNTKKSKHTGHLYVYYKFRWNTISIKPCLKKNNIWNRAK